MVVDSCFTCIHRLVPLNVLPSETLHTYSHSIPDSTLTIFLHDHSLGKMRARKAAHFKYKKYFDAKQGKFYWVNQQTQVASWKVTPWLIRQDIPMPSEDSLLYASQLKIRELGTNTSPLHNNPLTDIHPLTHPPTHPPTNL